jgi:glycerol-3-phosphate acyltransferase PlsY
MTLVLVTVAAYLLGSVPFGVLVTRLFTGKDVRAVGSGNIGASNVARAAGKGAAIVTLLLDAAKASLPMLAALSWFGAQGPAAADLAAVLVGAAAFAGHLFPLWLGFKGGKGVATALGVFLVLAPIAALLAVVTFGLVFALTRIPAIGSIAGTTVCAVGAIVHVARNHEGSWWSSPVSWAAIGIALVIFLRHRANIERLLRGTENKV